MKRQASAKIPTPHGLFTLCAYANKANDPMPQLAFVSENFDTNRPVPVRIHSECMTGDVFGSQRCDCGEQLQSALHLCGQEGGVVLYLRQEGRGIGLINKLKAYNLQDVGFNTIDANTHLGFDADARQYECAIFMLQDLGIQRIRLITNNPDKVAALQGSPIEVVDRIPLVMTPKKDNLDYLLTKQDLMGHLLGL